MFNFFKLKPVTIALLLLILWIPIQMISSLIEERQQLSVLVMSKSPIVVVAINGWWAPYWL